MSLSNLKPLVFFCLVPLFAQQASATTYSVTTTSDPCASGGGCLRDAVTQSNTAGGTNALSWSGASSGGTITLGSDLPTIITNTTLDVSAAASAVTISGDTVPISGTVTFNNNSANVWTINSDISGSGALSQTSTGTLVLNGVNSFAGGVTVSSGTLQINSDASLGASGAVVTLMNGATVQTTAYISTPRSIILNAQTAAFNVTGSSMALTGVISGAGTLNKIGSNTLLLTGANTYTGGTNLNAGTLSLANNSALGTSTLTFTGGTLQANAALTLPNNIVLNAGGGTIDLQGNNSTFSGVLSGAGGLTLTSTGTLTLTGTNTYTGGTAINNGVINITNSSSLGTGAVALSGGMLQFGAAFALANTMTLNVAVSSVDTQGYNATLSGVISGTGNLTKIGSGILTLTGANTYTGGTVVNAGTLLLGASNALRTTTDLTVNSGGTFDMSSNSQTLATFNANGNGGTLSLQVQPTPTAAKLTVTGNATFNNTTLNTTLAPQIVTNGETFNAISYGSKTSTFSAITSPAAVTFTPTYNATSLVLTASVNPYSSLAANPNQAAVASVLQPFQFAATGDLATVISNLNTLTGPQIQAAFDQIGPVGLAAMGGLGLAGYSVQSAAMSRRMNALAEGSAPSGFASYAMNAKSFRPGDLLASAGNPDTGELAPGAWTVSPASPWGFFTSGIFTNGRLNEGTSTSGLQPGYSFTTTGLTAGADYRFNDHFAAGLSGGWLRGQATIFSPGSGSVSNQSARYGVYGTYFTDNWHANLYLGGAEDFFTTNRGINFGSISRTATASPHGREFNADPSLSYDIRVPDAGTFSPFAGVDYDRLWVGGFTESGADSLDLSVSPQTVETLQSSLGLRFSEQLTAEESGAITPFATLAWRHEFENQSRPIDAQLATAGGTQFSVRTGDFARDGTLAGAGVSGTFSDSMSAKLEYTGDFRSHYRDNMVNANVRWKF